jgi:hypothetical protein
MKIMRLIMVLLFTAAFSMQLHAGQSGTNEGVDPEPECDLAPTFRILH